MLCLFTKTFMILATVSVVIEKRLKIKDFKFCDILHKGWDLMCYLVVLFTKCHKLSMGTPDHPAGTSLMSV